MAKAITKDNFKEWVLDSPQPVVVDFWAPWCGPCKMLVPIIDELAEEYKDTVRIGKVNVDEEADLANQFGVSSIPTVIVFNKGQVIRQSMGFKPKQQIVDLFKDQM